MKTTEIFVEQVIIGGLVMLIGYILFQQNILDYLECLSSHFTNIKPFGQISLGALLVGTAYLIGMVYDRFTDTLFQDLERHCRWSYVLKHVNSKEDMENVLRCVKFCIELYAENIYRISVLSSVTACQKEDYFRRRLRLTRAFATLIPGLSIAVILQMSIDCTNDPWYKFKAALIPVSYLLAFLVKNVPAVISKNDNGWRFITGENPPKTNGKKEKIKRYCNNHTSKFKRSLLPSILSDRAFQILFFIFMILALVTTILLRNIKYFIIMVIGIIFSMIVAWTWWRIYHTYFQFLRDFYEANFGEKSK